MDAKDYINIISIIASPVFAVIITLWYSNRKEKRRAQVDLFLTLVAHRKAYPPPYRFIDALNTIDIIFHNKPKIRAEWVKVYSHLMVQLPANVNITEYNKAMLDLLDEMARTLRYKNVKQTNLDSYYTPTLYENERLFQKELNNEWLRVVRNSQHLGSSPPPNHKDQKQSE